MSPAEETVQYRYVRTIFTIAKLARLHCYVAHRRTELRKLR